MDAVRVRFIGKAGVMENPCNKPDCEDGACENNRLIAESICRLCGKKIGWGVWAYLGLELNSHLVCEEDLMGENLREDLYAHS